MNEAFLERLSRLWLAKARLALDHKRESFQKDADECLRFYASRHDFIYAPGYWASRVSHEMGSGSFQDAQVAVPHPSLRITVNKTAEFVQVYGPALYARNPHRKVTPRTVPPPPQDLFGLDASTPAPEPGMPMSVEQMQYALKLQQYQALLQQEQAKQRMKAYKGTLLENLLNYTPGELDLKAESRNAIDEALIKGRGLLWHGVWDQNGRLPWSYFDTVDNLLLDPDRELLRDCRWCMQICREPWWELERRYGLPFGSLKEKAKKTSAAQAAGNEQEARQNVTADMITYYRVYSRMGFGMRLSEYAGVVSKELDEEFGDHVFLVVAEDVPFPLNWHPDRFKGALGDLQQALRWPVEFWKDPIHPWPFSELDFHWRPRSVWPVPPLSFAMGYQQFLDWAYSAMASKVVRTCRDIVVYDPKHGGDLMAALREGGDLPIIPLSKGAEKTWDEIVRFLQYPEMNADLWRILQEVSHAFERATGLTELMAGTVQHAYRSAEEAQLKGDFARIRPDDMANKVGDWMSLACRKEGFIAQTELYAQDIALVLGDANAFAWQQLVEGQNPSLVARELEFGIEAGSAKRKNLEADIANSETAMQFFAPLVNENYKLTGDPTQLNALTAWWAEPRGINKDLLQFPPLPMAPPPMDAPPEETQEPKQAA